MTSSSATAWWAPTVNREELEAAVLTVLGTADDFDDVIKTRFGGQRGADVVREDEA